MDECCQPSLFAGCRGCALKVLSFGGKADFLRRNAGLTIGDLADKTGVPERTLERILEGQGAPRASHFVRIVKALRMNIDLIEPGDLEEGA